MTTNEFTYTPSISDKLAQACGGNLNMAGMAARIAAFIRNGRNNISIEMLMQIYGWSRNTTRKYADQLIALGIFEVKFGSHRGSVTEWRKGAFFAVFFGEKGCNNCNPKGAKIATINNNKIKNNNNNFNNNLDTAPVGAICNSDDYYRFYGTTEDIKGWHRQFLPTEHRTIYTKQYMEG